MCRILLSINPEHVKNIMDETKRYEYRKIECSRQIDSIVIYATYPVCKVVGEVKVLDVIVDEPENIWKLTNMWAGISHDFFKKYYSKASKAVAYKLGQVTAYSSPRTLADFGVKYAPQSFVYL